ncbi:cartilage acidic protein 1-like [Mytilus californianus]|uniref:cartilage acidic protein 1-like n=1 Tax=Mytilus californianus TaxID=6549 RepID=UPI002246F486|nr:cartilage acidic protein 1-like [Mytilus californianus]
MAYLSKKISCFALLMTVLTEYNHCVTGIFTKLPWLYKIETEQLNYGVAVSDVDNDGDLEWIVAGFSGSNFVLKYNKKSGYLDNIAKRNTPYKNLMDPKGQAIGVCACDIDGDGREEIYFLNTNKAYSGMSSYSDKLFKWRNGQYEDILLDSINKNLQAKNYAGRSVACVDRFGSGKYSIAVATYSHGGKGNFALLEVDEFNSLTDRESGVLVIRNVAAETGISKSTGGRGLVVGPILNNNGLSDIFFANEGNEWIGNPGDNFLFKNLGNGTFVDIATETGILDGKENGRGIALADLNNDGLLDIVNGNWEGKHRIFLQSKSQNGERYFRNVASAFFEQPSPIRTVLAADFDNNMQTDIFMNNILTDSKPQPNYLYGVKVLLDSNITIVERDVGEAIEKEGYGTGAAYTDMNGDGVLELLISHGESNKQPLSVYTAKQEKTFHNNWLRVKPLTRYGAPARGALVSLNIDSGIRLTQVIDGGSGYLCQMEPVAHFGLGKHKAVTVEVLWTDGEKISKKLNDNEINKLIIIQHPVLENIYAETDIAKDNSKFNVTVSTTLKEEL